MVWLNRTYYSLLKFTSKILKNCLPQSNSSELCKFHAIRPHSPRITRNSHILLTHSTFISGTCTGRELSGIPANYADSAQFTHTVRESREIRTICKHYTLRFRCLTSGRELPKIPANQAKFAQIRPHIPRITRIPHISH